MPLDQRTQPEDLLGQQLMVATEPVGVDQLGIHHRGQSDPGVVDKYFTTSHAGAEVVSHRAKHHQGSPGHVLGAMLPRALDHR